MKPVCEQVQAVISTWRRNDEKPVCAVKCRQLKERKIWMNRISTARTWVTTVCAWSVAWLSHTRTERNWALSKSTGTPRFCDCDAMRNVLCGVAPENTSASVTLFHCALVLVLASFCQANVTLYYSIITLTVWLPDCLPNAAFCFCLHSTSDFYFLDFLKRFY